MRSFKFVILFAFVVAGCGSASGPSFSYRREAPDRTIEDLPAILPSAELRDGAFAVPNTDEWFRIARDHQLTGKHLDEAIAAYGVLVLDQHMTIIEVTTDPG
jgi:hypothetical protein